MHACMYRLLLDRGTACCHVIQVGGQSSERADVAPGPIYLILAGEETLSANPPSQSARQPAESVGWLGGCLLDAVFASLISA